MPHELPDFCKKCKRPRGDKVGFRFDKRDGLYRGICNQCNNERVKANAPADPPKPEACKTCHQPEGPDLFFQLNGTGYYRKECNQCRRYKMYIYKAKTRNIAWDAHMTREFFVSLMLALCFYCNERDGLNGIDRFDSAKGYSRQNCVPCCTRCNYAKGSMDGLTYIMRSKHIHAFVTTGVLLFPQVFSDSIGTPFRKSKYEAKRDGRPFELTREQYKALQASPCIVCGKQGTETHKNGIDRNDSKGGYTMDNVSAMCGNCNIAKGTMTLQEFYDHSGKIANHADRGTLPEAEQQLRAITKRVPQTEHEQEEVVYV